MQGEERNAVKKKAENTKTDKTKKENQFVGIEKKISQRFGQVTILCCIVLGVVTSVLSYISSISAVSKTINNTSDVAAAYVSAAIDKYVSIAYETGSIARLADPDKSILEKAAILRQKINDHNFEGGFLLDSRGGGSYYRSKTLWKRLFYRGHEREYLCINAGVQQYYQQRVFCGCGALVGGRCSRYNAGWRDSIYS